MKRWAREESPPHLPDSPVHVGEDSQHTSVEPDSTISQDHTGGNAQRERNILSSESAKTEPIRRTPLDRSAYAFPEAVVPPHLRQPRIHAEGQIHFNARNSTAPPRSQATVLPQTTHKTREEDFPSFSPSAKLGTRKRKAEEVPFVGFSSSPLPTQLKRSAKGSTSDNPEQDGHLMSTILTPEVPVSTLNEHEFSSGAIERPETLKPLSELDLSDLHRLHKGAETPKIPTNIGNILPQESLFSFLPIEPSFKASLPAGNPVQESDDKNSGLHTIVERSLCQVETLKKENFLLQKQFSPNFQNAGKPSFCPWVLVHRLSSTYYSDAPQWKEVQIGSWEIESRKRISNFEVFLEKHRINGVAFVATFDYDHCTQTEELFSTKQKGIGLSESFQQADKTTVRPTHLSIRFLSEVLAAAWDNLLDMDQNLKRIHHSENQVPSFDPKVGNSPGLEHFQMQQMLPGEQSPENISKQQEFLEHQRYLKHQDVFNAEVYFYYFRTSIQKTITAMETEDENGQFDLLIRFVEESFREEYREVDELLSQGLISGMYIKYLSAPGTVLITHENGNSIGYLQNTFFDDKNLTEWTTDVMNWTFDGKFKLKEKCITIDAKDFKYTPRRITSLKYYPLKYADSQIVQNLKNRGDIFWRCRKSAYVSYTGLDMNQEATYDNTRFLIDVRTYHTMHAGNGAMRERLSESFQLPDAIMNRDQPPDDGFFIYIVPASIYGFDIQEKKWVSLQVDNIHQLEWNTEAFKSLAIDKDSKELINALVNNKIAAEKATDMVRGKGNGLIILLHGGPGTGKTLTAESVAEIAKKPLYRVTCGDIGTEPREVEKYLQKVFHLGKIWDCVVLLDEADVFLEQRTLSDLSRNALVSVFLRTLEYYDGILILTSNRVGTFDEAFKSRIQLALHYPNLDLAQRKQIWKNFTHRLDSLEEDVDTDAILASINKLAKYEMNGRQIRNAITTARQLALFKKETLTTKHMEHSIRVSGKFDQYLEEVHDQIKDDEMARQSGFR